MIWICPQCKLKLRISTFPIYCMCGYVAECEADSLNNAKPNNKNVEDFNIDKQFNLKYEKTEMPIPLTRNEQIKADELIKELEKEGIQKHDFDKPPEGLGDTVERVLTKFGITKEFVKKITGQKTCGCDKRKQWLNKIFPYVK